MEKAPVPNKEEGSVLVVALITLVLLTVIGISASTTSNIEIRVAGNEKFHKMAFYAADGGGEAGCELLEQNIEDRGFDAASVGSANVANADFWTNLAEPANADVQIPNVGGSLVSLKYNGNSELSTGGAIQLIAGYEGKGKGAGGSGAFMVFDVRSRADGVSNAEAEILTRWRHMI